MGAQTRSRDEGEQGTPQPDPDRSGRLRRVLFGLQGRLFLWTFLFVMIAEVMVFIPSLGMFYKTWLSERVSAAQIGALVHEAGRTTDSPDPVSGLSISGPSLAGSLEANVLDRTGVSVMILTRGSVRESLFMVENPPTPDVSIDLGRQGRIWSILPAFHTLIAPDGRTLHVIGSPLSTGETVEIVLPEEPLRAAMIAYCHNILLLSLLIAAITAGLVYLSTHIVLVRPIRRIITSMMNFSERPEDASRIMPLPRTRARTGGELADAARALNRMQTDLRGALQQKTRLAALGTAVGKINHDLRNILSSAQLIADRLPESEDPTVRRIAPKLVRSIDRAIALCTQTLKYGRVEDPVPVLQWCDLEAITEDVRSSLALPEQDSLIALDTRIAPEMRLYGDPEHIFRILLNLTRNARQALETQFETDKSGGRAGDSGDAGAGDALTGDGEPDGSRTVRKGSILIRARERDRDSRPVSIIDVVDNGPGIPEAVRPRLFEAFSSAARKGGTGLGLAIARELAQAMGGTLELAATGPAGTTFRLVLPLPGKDG